MPGRAVGERLSFAADGVETAFADVFAGWRDDAAFRELTIEALAAAPYPAFFWEMPPLRAETVRRPYEGVLLESGALARLPADPGAFADQFQAAPAFTRSRVSQPRWRRDAGRATPIAAHPDRRLRPRRRIFSRGAARPAA